MLQEKHLEGKNKISRGTFQPYLIHGESFLSKNPPESLPTFTHLPRVVKFDLFHLSAILGCPSLTSFCQLLSLCRILTDPSVCL